MPRVNPVGVILGLYIPFLLVGLLMPRNESVNPAPAGFFKRLLHDILFLTGPPEIILNFLLFIPFFFALLFLVPKLSGTWAALICCYTSAAAELAQLQIPGRVSSLRDFFSNCLGVILGLAITGARARRKDT